MLQQLRYTLTIVVVLVAVIPVYSQKKVRFADIDLVSHDDGPSSTPEEKNRQAQLAQLLQDIEKAQKDYIVFLKQEMKQQPVDQSGKSAAIKNLQNMSDKLVETMNPNMDAGEKAGMKTTVLNDLEDQSKCLASAEIQGVAAMCKRATQEKVKAAMSQ